MSDANANPAPIAPGEEAGYIPIDDPFSGPAVHEHMGPTTLNQEFAFGASSGRF